MKHSKLIRLLILCGFIGLLQYLVITGLLMYEYPGGTVIDHSTIGYRFTENFISDLGRTSIFGRQSNPAAFYYKLTLSAAGTSIVLFFFGFLKISSGDSIKALPMITFLLGVISGLAYIGIALNPLNQDYHDHVTYVQLGFIAFLGMTFFFAMTIYRDPYFSNFYAVLLLFFSVILALQICIMIFGPRSWSSIEALRLQVIAQKIVVYVEIFIMMILMWGTYKRSGAAETEDM